MRLSLEKLVDYWSKKYPEAIAIVSPTKKINYKTLSELVASYSCTVLNSNARYGVIVHDVVSYVSLILAMMRDRRVFINIESIVSHEQLFDFVDTNKIDFIITDKPGMITDNRVSVISLESLKNSNLEATGIYQNMNDVVGGFLSSGSTGIPKVYYRNQYSLISEALLWIMELELTHNTSFYISKPFSYIGSFVLLYSVLYTGGTVCVPNNFNGLEIPLFDFAFEYAFLTPSDIRTIIKQHSKIICKNIITMGAPITREEKKTLSELSNCNVYELWGNSEGLATITNTYEDPECSSLGRATFTDLLFVVDKTTKKKMPPFSIGYIAGITDNGVEGNDLDDIIISDDIGYIDDQNRLHLIGRSSNVVIFSNGLYFCTTEFEEKIRVACCISEVAVLLSHNLVYVFLRLDDLSLEDRIQHLFNSEFSVENEELSLGKIVFLDDIPYTNNGKIDYYQLRLKYIRFSE